MLVLVFERFTDRARRVLVLAQDEARSLHHQFIGTEHVLLGLLAEGEGVAARALEELGVSLTAARHEVERADRQIVEKEGRVQEGSESQPPFTPRAKKVLELSLREALQLGHQHIGTEHILLGLVREGGGVATQVLVDLGIEPGRVRQGVIRLMAPSDERRERQGRQVWSVVSSSCVLCGRDVWEVAHHFAADQVRVCDVCIRAAATVLAAAGTEPRELALPPRVFGDVPDESAVDELVGTVLALVGTPEERARRAEVIEDAAALEPRLRVLDDLLTGTARVSRVRFHSDAHAELRFHFRVVGVGTELAAEGPARRVDGRWVLWRVAALDALERAGVRAREAGG